MEWLELCAVVGRVELAPMMLYGLVVDLVTSYGSQHSDESTFGRLEE
jgi:hypothetical protein